MKKFKGIIHPRSENYHHLLHQPQKRMLCRKSILIFSIQCTMLSSSRNHIKTQIKYWIFLCYCSCRFPSLWQIIAGVFWPWSGWSQNAETTSTVAHTCTRNSRRSCWPPSRMRGMWWSANMTFTRWPKPTGHTHTTAGGRDRTAGLDRFRLTASGVWMGFTRRKKTWENMSSWLINTDCLWMKVNKVSYKSHIPIFDL